MGTFIYITYAMENRFMYVFFYLTITHNCLIHGILLPGASSLTMK